MKEATGELNMTIITVVAIAALGVFLWAFLPGILQGISDSWSKGQGSCNLKTQHQECTEAGCTCVKN